MNNVARLSTAVGIAAGIALALAPVSAFAMIYNPAPGTPYYAAPQGYTSYFGGQPQYSTGGYYPTQYAPTQYQPQQYQPQPSYVQQPVQNYAPIVTVQPINYQPFTQMTTPYFGQQQQQQQYGYQPQQYYTNGYYTQPSYGYSTGQYAGYYGANNPPIDMGYATGDHDTFGSPICYYADYGRADCGSNPNQPVYDVWTGTWY